MSKKAIPLLLLIVILVSPMWLSAKEMKQSLTIRSFPANLAHNFFGLFEHQNIGPLVVGLDATAAAYAFDDNIRDYFKRETTFDQTAKVASFIGNYYVIGGAVGGLFIVGNLTSDRYFHSMTYALAQGYVINNAWTNLAKFSFHRVRPDETNKRSFLSGHASNAFMVATVLNHYYGAKVGVPAYLVAGMVGASRVEKRRHFLSDVVAGSTLGYIVGRTVAHNSLASTKEPRLSYFPMFSPSRKEIGLNLSIRF